jgi:internalin A
MNEAAAKQRRPRMRALSLRAMLLLVLVVGLAFGWVINEARVERKAVQAIEAADAYVLFDFQHDRALEAGVESPRWKKWIVDHLGPEYAGDVNYVVTSTCNDQLLAQLARLDGLEELILLCDTDRGLTDAGLATALRALHRLKRLVLADAPALSGSGLAQLASLHRLKALELELPNAVDIGLANLPLQLEELFISMPKVTDAGFVHLSKLKNLRKLSTRNVPITSLGLAHLNELRNMRQLTLEKTLVDTLEPIGGLRSIEELDIQDGPMTAAGMSPLQNWKKLKRLRLSHLELSDGACSSLTGHNELTHVDLWSSLVPDSDLQYLASLPALENLDLSATGITDAGIEHLGHSKSLKYIDIARNTITDRGLQALANVKSLKGVDAQATEITTAGASQLRLAIPAIDVRLDGLPDAFK